MCKLFYYCLIVTVAFTTSVQANQASQFHQGYIDKKDQAVLSNFGIKSYGHFKKMVHMKKTKGVVSLKEAISSKNTYAIGAIGEGRGEITVLNSEIFLDYGQDGLGKSVQEIPANEKAVLLVTAEVPKWHQIITPDNLSGKHLHSFILEQAQINKIDTMKPFPFMLEGKFDNFDLHVINGVNKNFAGHGGKEKFYKQHKMTKQNQKATIVGFYSANNQGIYTHPGESWHLHAVLKNEGIGAHVDGVDVQKSAILKLPQTIL